jgi:cell division protein FtsQ
MPLIVLVGLVALVVAVVVSATPVAAVRTVTVTGPDPVLNRQAQAVIDESVGTPIVRVDTQELRRQVVELSPSIKDVDVRRVLPSTLEVTVVGRQPVLALVDRDSSTTWLVDAEGTRFGKGTKPEPGTPRLVVADRLVGDDREAAVGEATAVLGSIPAEVRTRVKSMRVESRDDIRFTLKGNREVRWGSAADSVIKAAVLSKLVASVPAKVYDVSAPELPTTRKSL